MKIQLWNQNYMTRKSTQKGNEGIQEQKQERGENGREICTENCKANSKDFGVNGEMRCD